VLRRARTLLSAGVLTAQAIEALDAVETFAHAAGALRVLTALLVFQGTE